MSNRMTKWVIFTLIFALIPIILSLLLNYILNMTKDKNDFIGEILFFTIMVSSTTLSDIVSLNRYVKDYILIILIGIFILLVMFASVLYGSLLFVQINNISTEILNKRFFNASLYLGIFSGTLGTGLQVFLCRTKEVK